MKIICFLEDWLNGSTGLLSLSCFASVLVTLFRTVKIVKKQLLQATLPKHLHSWLARLPAQFCLSTNSSSCISRNLLWTLPAVPCLSPGPPWGSDQWWGGEEEWSGSSLIHYRMRNNSNFHFASWSCAVLHFIFISCRKITASWSLCLLHQSLITRMYHKIPIIPIFTINFWLQVLIVTSTLALLEVSGPMQK